MKKRILSAALGLLLLLSLSGGSWAAASDETLDTAATNALQYLFTTVPEPEYAQIGGEWTILALARGGYAAPASYYARYYQMLEETVQEKNGVLDANKYTEYARVVLALSAIGKDARNVAGYDLVAPLYDSATVNDQGLNGTIFALLALDSVQGLNSGAATAAKEGYLQTILDAQLRDGGWNLGGTNSDPDMTAMALQALAKYESQSAVSTAISKGVTRLGKKQASNGGYTNAYGEGNAETVAQVIVALCELGISLEDSRFVKEGNTLLDNLLSFQSEDGGFKHKLGDAENDGMSSEQASYALAAARRISQGKSSLYRMNDVTDLTAGGELPIVRDCMGNLLTAEQNTEGSVSFTAALGSVTVTLNGSGSSFSAASTGDVACVVLVKNADGGYSPRTITTAGGAHALSVYAGEEIILAVTGDLNGDGRVSALEARMALKASANPSALDALKTAIADLDANGKLSALEARRLLRASANPNYLPW